MPVVVSADTADTNSTAAETNSSVSENVTTVATTVNPTTVFVGADGTITVTVRGSTDFNIGDRIYFDGTSNASQSLVLKMAGPGLSSDGVPLDDPTGTAGSGSLVSVGSNGKWTYAWDTSLLANTPVQTAKYTIYAVDLANPTVSTKIGVMIHKKTLSFTLTPNPVPLGQTITLEGTTTADVSQVRFDMVRVPELASERSSIGYDILLAADGSFSKQFHADLPAGTYTATVKTPDGTLTKTQTYLIGLDQTVSATEVATTEATPVVTETTLPATAATTVAATTTATQSQAPATTTSPTVLYIVIAVLVIVVIIGAVLYVRSKKTAQKPAQEQPAETEESEEED